MSAVLDFNHPCVLNATHPAVLNALFRPSAGGCAGHGGTSREVFALVDAAHEHQRAHAASEALSAV